VPRGAAGTLGELEAEGGLLRACGPLVVVVVIEGKGGH